MSSQNLSVSFGCLSQGNLHQDFMLIFKTDRPSSLKRLAQHNLSTLHFTHHFPLCQVISMLLLLLFQEKLIHSINHVRLNLKTTPGDSQYYQYVFLLFFQIPKQLLSLSLLFFSGLSLSSLPLFLFFKISSSIR